jgi:adenine-specific DNA glycosylase
MLALGEAVVAGHIRTIGLWRNKAKNVIALSQALIDNFGGEVPGDRDALMTLPGVGRKTANVVLNMAFGQPTMAVDTHIFRIGNRTKLAPGKTPDEVETSWCASFPDQYMRHAHHWLILHGRYVCKARKPDCWNCVIADICNHLGPERPIVDIKFPAFQAEQHPPYADQDDCAGARAVNHIGATQLRDRDCADFAPQQHELGGQRACEQENRDVMGASQNKVDQHGRPWFDMSPSV